MKFSKEFNEAISRMDSKEKDKLILRLLKKDVDLANKLVFELLDDRSPEEITDEFLSSLKPAFEKMRNYVFAPGHLMMVLRDFSGEITRHVKITKDKFGEVKLNLVVFIEGLKIANDLMDRYTPGKKRKFNIYIISRAFKIMTLMNKLHEDYLIEAQDDLSTLGELIGKNPDLMKTAIQHGLDVNWLIEANIPDDIAEIQKDLRARGYLSSKTYLNSPNSNGMRIV